MRTLALSIATPEGSLYEGQCVQVTIPGAEGVFGVLAGHMNLVAQIKPGIVYIQDEAGNVEKIAVADGLADIDGQNCVILIEAGQLLSDVNLNEIKNKLELVKHKLLKADSETIANSFLTEKEFLEVIIENFNNDE